MTAFVFRRQITVEYGHCDPTGVVFITRLFQYFDTSTWMMFEAATGVDRRDFPATVAIIPLVDVHAHCVQPVMFGDAIEIASRVSEFRRSSFHVEHRVTVGGALAVNGGETRVWAMRRKDDPERISAVAVPPEVIARFS